MIWVGVIGVVAAVACGVLWYMSRERTKAMTGTETTTIGDLRQLRKAIEADQGVGNFAHYCELNGVVEPNSKGALKSALAGVDCVWHKQKITRKYRSRDSEGRTQTRTEVVAKNATTDIFVIDDGTGKVGIDPHGDEPDGADKIVDRFVRRDSSDGPNLQIGPFKLGLGNDTIGYQEEEWVIRPGRRLYILGEASTASGRLHIGAPSKGGIFVMSTKSEVETVKTERLKQYAFLAGSALAVVVGAVGFVMAATG